MKNILTVVIVTYKTNKKILDKCLGSIDNKIKIIIVENSKNFEDQKYFSMKYKNLKIVCSGSNLGYGNGNNLGLSKVKTKYGLILNPDTYCSNKFFKNLFDILKKIKDFHLIGCAYSRDKKTYPAGYFNFFKNKNFEGIINTNKIDLVTKVDWIKGFSIVLNMKKFKKGKVFDKNYFLYFEELDLCKSIKRSNGNIYFIKNLKVDHLGFKGSVGASNLEKQNAEKLRNWHYMWSSFYFYKKNYSYFYAINQISGKFIRSLIKTIFFFLTFQTQKKIKYLYRFLGIFSSIVGLKAYYRAKKFY
ncbi:glycosyltransferase [Candidatus Pelagibacter sp.]|nr:glycosyltransferase [Candidatus Pelagibacter sp.]